MLESDIRAKDPDRQAIADAVAAFKAGGGKVERLGSRTSTHTPSFGRNLIRKDDQGRSGAVKPKPRPKAPTIEEQLKAEADEVRRRTDEILEIIERLRQKEAKK